MARRFDLRINQGETWRCEIPVRNADGTAKDLTGATVRGQIRVAHSSGAALHTWALIEDNLDLAAGQITLHVPAVVSTDWSWVYGLWDLEMTDIFGTTTRLVEGVVWVSPEITR